MLIMIMQVPGITHPELILVTGFALFGVPFAVNSSFHWYLILAYAGSEKAAEDVGFYYAANAAGRLIGIVLSGALTQFGGLSACLWGSAAMLAVCLLLTFLLPAGSEARRAAAARQIDPGAARAADAVKAAAATASPCDHPRIAYLATAGTIDSIAPGALHRCRRCRR